MAEEFAKTESECFDCGGWVRPSMVDPQGTCVDCGGKKKRETSDGWAMKWVGRLFFGMLVWCAIASRGGCG